MPRPFGTLRDQMSNWLGSDQNRAVLASVALAHGIPHKGVSFCGLISATKLRVKPATQSNITFSPDALRPCCEGVWGKRKSTYFKMSGRSEPANHWPV
jgi:hypothetical protein